MSFTQLVTEYPGATKMAATIVAAAIVSWLFAGLIHHVHKRLLAKPDRIWQLAFIGALNRPLMVLIWAIAFSVFLPTLLAEWNLGLSYGFYYTKARYTIFILSAFWFIMRVIKQAESGVKTQVKLGVVKHDQTNVRALAQVFRIIAVILTLLMLMQNFNFQITSLLAAGGIGALAIAFAAKDTLANFIGGMMIFWDRPFGVGDWISSPDQNLEGTVEDIGWRLTRIRTFDKRPLYVPNGLFSSIIIVNPSHMLNRRIKETIGLRYEDAPKAAVILKAIEEMLRNHPAIDTKQTLMVNIFHFGESSIDFFVYTFTKTTDWVKFQGIQQDVFLKIIDIITQHGAECAFPTRTLDVPESMMGSLPQQENTA